MRGLWLFVFALGVPFFTAARAGDTGRPPNILVIVADDVGWGEFGFQGRRDVPTPHIDSIAREGVRFTQGYVSCPVCAPTRAGLLTGKYPTRFGFELYDAGKDSGIPDNVPTLAQRLRSLGYETSAVGKWHVGLKERFRPLRRGFQDYYGTLLNSPYFRPELFLDTRVSARFLNIDDPGFYTTTAYGERAVESVQLRHGKPWFLYLAFNAAHTPYQAPQEYVEQ